MTTDAPPDWSTHPGDLTCPLCDYNLRGLTEPRCPECGFAFAWAELLDAGRERHPWLFEHAVPGRRRRAFLRTWVCSAMPRRFWRDVTPANPVRRGRLSKYWVCTTLLLAGVILVPLLSQAVHAAIEISDERAMVRSIPQQPGTFILPGRFQTYTAAELRLLLPPVWSVDFARQVADGYLRRTGGAFVAVVVTAAAWPWLTTASLLVFQISMRRAKTNGLHVLRTAIYSCECSLLVMALAVLMYWLMGDGGRSVRGHELLELSAALAIATAGLCAVVTTFRLTIAYGRYLRFHLPLATVIASQIIAFLAMLGIAVNVAQGW